MLKGELTFPLRPICEGLVFGKQRIDACFRTKFGAAVVRDARQDRRQGLGGGTHVMRPLSIEAVEVFLQDQLAVAGNQKTVDVYGIIQRIGT